MNVEYVYILTIYIYIYIYTEREREHTVRSCSFLFVVFRLAS